MAQQQEINHYTEKHKMINPTTGNQSQFSKPFNILPDIIYLNPLQTVVNAEQLAQNNDINQWDQSSQADFTSEQNKEYANWTPNTPSNTNATVSQGLIRLQALGTGIVSSFAGIPILTQVAGALAANTSDSLSGTYRTVPLNGLSNKNLLAAVKYPDFRSSIALDIKNSFNNFGEVVTQLGTLVDRNINGASAILRGSSRSAIYSAAAASPAGAYSIFNRETLYGTGDHDFKFSIRADFTLRSHIAKQWNSINAPAIGLKPGWIPTTNPIEIATPFTGDKVNVIDYSKRKLSKAYKWQRIDTTFGANIPGVGASTTDFIKFYFTGPMLHNNSDAEDEIIVFRSHITSLSDTFNPTWTPVNMIGRADPNYIYQNYSRDISMNFTVYATSRDEVQPIWRKLNALAGFTAPEYIDSIAMKGPWMRITIGDLFVQQPVVLNSLSYTYDMDAPWEINIEADPTMMQVPLKIDVQCGFNVITDYIPQKTGRFYTLAKQFSADAEPIRGSDNWLSDFKDNVDAKPKVKETRQTGPVNNIEDKPQQVPVVGGGNKTFEPDDRLTQYTRNNTFDRT